MAGHWTSLSLSLVRTPVRGLLYLSAKSSTLGGSVRSPRDLAVASTDDVARGLQSVLRPSRAGARVAALRPGIAQRQRAQIHGSDAGARDRPGIVPSLPALHHRRAVECRRRVAAAARGRAGTRRPADFRWDEFSQQGPHSLGVARRSCGALGEIATARAVTAALWTGARGYLLGAALSCRRPGSPSPPAVGPVPAPCGFCGARRCPCCGRSGRAVHRHRGPGLRDWRLAFSRPVHRRVCPRAVISSHLSVFLAPAPARPPGAARSPRNIRRCRGASARPLCEALVRPVPLAPPAWRFGPTRGHVGVLRAIRSRRPSTAGTGGSCPFLAPAERDSATAAHLLFRPSAPAASWSIVRGASPLAIEQLPSRPSSASIIRAHLRRASPVGSRSRKLLQAERRAGQSDVSQGGHCGSSPHTCLPSAANLTRSALRPFNSDLTKCTRSYLKKTCPRASHR